MFLHTGRSFMKIKAFIFDVDGTLTDGRKHYFKTTEGVSISKAFSVRDGKGIDLAKKAGLKVCLITADGWELIFDRAKDMGINDVFYKSHDKIRDAKKFCDKYNLDLSEVCFVGDDVNDIPLLESVGYPAAVGDALPKVKDACKNKNGYVANSPGGFGAVREIIDSVLKENKNA